MTRLLFIVFLQNYAIAGAVCDGTYSPQFCYSQNATTPSWNSTLSVTAFLDPVARNPPLSTNSYFIRCLKPTSQWADCNTGNSPLLSYYTVSIQTTACKSFLYWDSDATKPCTADLQVSAGSPSFAIYAKASNSTPIATTECNVTSKFNDTTGITRSTSKAYSVKIQHCNADTLTWKTPEFTIDDFDYYVQDPAKELPVSFAVQTNACGYAITYSLMVQSPLAAADSSVFSLVDNGSAKTLKVETSSHLKAKTYNLLFRAQLWNKRTNQFKTLDKSFKVEIIDRCASTTLKQPDPALQVMTTTALSTSSVSQTLTVSDEVSVQRCNQTLSFCAANPYCGNRIYSIVSGMSPQSFLTFTNNTPQSVLTLKSNQLSDANHCNTTCTVVLKVCLENYPSKCAATNPTLTVVIGPCVIENYASVVYPVLIDYTIGKPAFEISYPTFTQTPACGQSATISTTVNGDDFPGISQNSGGSMSSIFSENTATKRFTVYSNNRAESTFNYTFIFTSSLSSTISDSTTFTIQLKHPCLSTIIEDSGQTFSLTGTELQASETSVYSPFTNFKNSVAGTSLDTTTGCGQYTYSLDYSGTFLVFNPSAPSISVKSLLNTDSNGSPYNTVKLKGCLTNYPTVACFTKTLVVTINDCVISTYNFPSSPTSFIYNLYDPALELSLPVQTPDCGFTVTTNNCNLDTATGPACPSWVTKSAAGWSIYSNQISTVGSHTLFLTSTLNNTASTKATSTRTVEIVDICLQAQGNLITAGTVSDMTVSALFANGATQTLTQWPNSASTLFGNAATCGSNTFELVPGSTPYLSLSGTTITLKSTLLAEIGTQANFQIKQCLSSASYNNVCATASFKVTITACVVTSWSPSLLPLQIFYITDAATTSGYTTFLQIPACEYTYSVTPKLDNTVLPHLGVSIQTANSALSYHNLNRSTAGSYSLTWTFTAGSGCLGVCTVATQTTTLIWKDPCERTVISAPFVSDAQTTALAADAKVWSFSHVQDSVSLSPDVSPDPGYTYCGNRTYTLSGNSSWLSMVSSLNFYQFTLLSTSLNDYQSTPYLVSLTVSLPQYADVAPVTTTFQITIGMCLIDKLTPSASPAITYYILMGDPVSVDFPSYTQEPACNYPITYSCLYMVWDPNSATNVPNLPISDPSLVNLQNTAACDFSTKKVTADIKAHIFPTPKDLTSHQYQGDYGISVTMTATTEPTQKSNSSFVFILRVVNPCWWPLPIPSSSPYQLSANNLTSQVIPDIQTSVLSPPITRTFAAFEDDASKQLGSDGYSLCGPRNYTLTSHKWLNVSSSSTNLNLNFIELNVVDIAIDATPTRTTDVGTYTIVMNATLALYQNVTSTTSFKVTITDCVLTQFKAPVIVAQSYTIGISPALTVSIPTFTQTPNCQYPVTYSATFKKTAVANSNYITTTDLDEELSLDPSSTPYLRFNTTSGYSPLGNFTINSSQLADGGQFEVQVKAVVSQTTPDSLLDTNTDLTFQLTLIDPCNATILNGATTPQRSIPNFNTSVKLGQSGDPTNFSYTSVTHQFSTIVDSVSYQMANLDFSVNSASIFCGLRTYSFGGDGSSNPAWLSLDAVNGIVGIQTADDNHVKFNPGYAVTLVACLEYYPKTCSEPIPFTVIINECQILTFENKTIQPNLSLNIFDTSYTQKVVDYVQTPLCGWAQTYTATIARWTLPYTGTEYPVTETVTWGSSDSFQWAILNTTSLEWILRSTLRTDATTFTINQNVTLNNRYQNQTLNTWKLIQFNVTFTDLCLTTQLIALEGAGQIFDKTATSDSPIITTSVKVGTDKNANGSGNPVSRSFSTHKDKISNYYLQYNPSTYVCGDRMYSLSIAGSPGTNFLSVTSSANFATTPVISALTSSDSDVGVWMITLQISLVWYPQIQLSEVFWVRIDKCILNSITLQSTPRYNQTNPFSFELYQTAPLTLMFPTYEQAPKCGYPLLYRLTQIKSYDNSTGTYNTTSTTCKFAFLDTMTSTINFISENSTDDVGIYDGINPSKLLDAKPYQLQLEAYVDELVINPASPVKSNTQEQFWVKPNDSCYRATLHPAAVKNISYFLGGPTVYIYFSNTNDSVSMANISSSGYDMCGQRNYTLLIGPFWALQPSFAKVPNNQLSVAVKTKNAKNYGTQALRLITTLANYPKKSVHSEFTVTVYTLNVGQQFGGQYFQISKKPLALVWKPFYILPATEFFNPIIYTCSVTDSAGNELKDAPAWLTKCDSDSTQLQVFTREVADQGNYTINIIARLSNYSSPFSVSQSIPLEIANLPPPPIVASPPLFKDTLYDQEFTVGDPLIYELPAYYDPLSLKVTISKLGAPKWLDLDADKFVLSVKKNATKTLDAGTYPIQIQLGNTKGGKSSYKLTITVLLPPVTNTQVASGPKIAPPVPKIASVTSKGLLTVKWDQAIRVPRNLTLVSTGTVGYLDPITFAFSRKPNLEIQILPGAYSSDSDLTFTWNFTSWQSKTMVIQLYFNASDDVSKNVNSPEKIKLVFYGANNFLSENNVPVNGGKEPHNNSVLIFTLPHQVPLNKVAPVRRNNKAGLQSNNIGSLVYQLSYSAFLNFIWGKVDTQQIVILFPLLSVELPPNAADFFAQLMTIAAFALIPTDPIFGFLLNSNPNNLPMPLSENFEAVGFATTYITNNLGTVFFSLMVFPVSLVAYYILKPFSNKALMYQRIKIGRRIFWSQTFQSLSSEYTIITTCALIQVANLDWSSNYGTQFCSFFGILFLVITSALPFLVAGFCWKNYQSIKDGGKVFEQRFSSLWEGLRTDDRGFILYHWFFLFRRFILALVCVCLTNQIQFQLMLIIYNIQFAVVVAGETMCMQDSRLNWLEFFNESMMMLMVYTLISFTDFQPDPDIKLTVGTVLKWLVLFHIGFNLAYQSVDYVIELKLKYRRWKLYRDYAMVRALQNIKIQKQKRHLNFKSLSKVKISNKRKDLKAIPEQSREEGSNANSKSYDYAHDQSNQISFSKEISQSDLKVEDHFEINQGFSRQPVDAPEIKLNRPKEFADGSTTTDVNQNKRLGQRTQLDTIVSFEEQIHQNIKRQPPIDSIASYNQDMLAAADPFEPLPQGIKEKLQQRPINEEIIDLQKQDPLSLIHQRLVRMVQHDATLPSLKVQPQSGFTGLKVLPDFESIHSKLFQKYRGDGSSASDSQEPSRITGSKRKLIIPSAPLNSAYTDQTSFWQPNLSKSSITSLDELVKKPKIDESDLNERQKQSK